MKNATLRPALDDPQYAAAVRRLDELRADRRKRQAEIDEILAQPQAARLSAMERVTDAAKRLISGAAPASVRMDVERRSQIIAEKYAQAHVLDEAIRLQSECCEKLLQPLEARAAEAAAPGHREAVQRIVSAIVELDAANVAEAELREELVRLGYRPSAYLVPMPFIALGSLSDWQSRASMYLLECVTRGFIATGDLPANLRKHVPPPAPKVKAAPAATPADGWVGGAA